MNAKEAKKLTTEYKENKEEYLLKTELNNIFFKIETAASRGKNYIYSTLDEEGILKDRLIKKGYTVCHETSIQRLLYKICW